MMWCSAHSAEFVRTCLAPQQTISNNWLLIFSFTWLIWFRPELVVSNEPPQRTSHCVSNKKKCDTYVSIFDCSSILISLQRYYTKVYIYFFTKIYCKKSFILLWYCMLKLAVKIALFNPFQPIKFHNEHRPEISEHLCNMVCFFGLLFQGKVDLLVWVKIYLTVSIIANIAFMLYIWWLILIFSVAKISYGNIFKCKTVISKTVILHLNY